MKVRLFRRVPKDLVEEPRNDDLLKGPKNDTVFNRVPKGGDLVEGSQNDETLLNGPKMMRLS